MGEKPSVEDEGAENERIIRSKSNITNNREAEQPGSSAGSSPEPEAQASRGAPLKGVDVKLG